MKVDFEVTASNVTVKGSHDKRLRVDVEGADLKEFMEYVSDSDILKEIGEANIAFWFNNNDELYIEKFLDECHEENLAEYLESKGWTVSKEN
ncbi:hypothetical protein MY092_002094 [Salmonella enterica]|uniref:Uncharacterized protein n=1 Tax=Salmonella enterica subsp. enterica serovar Panama TaxID=29472 RepID=A0A5U8J4A2_SALET|nr:hypothetical protein [Salmonella enterica]EBR7994971.1 hypothetical protein [Salmonella enterica subsp. enterica serovar Panama]ASD90118.1 hypothetical protein LFZ16_28740 [Salmonella enterica subsp. enterica serovar India str. SA20085604]EBR8432933.1 hypothetical protein [Salmonella enterica subsp. enterica serovar Panama]EBW9459961.1 hypothetical protein [Salmonella enterica subsp. enterica serovar Panama]EJC4644786.1 hypothetical protein [Salmonella enterica]